MENNTAKHFVLQLGSLITLYLSISFLLVLLFNIINLLYPDAVDSYWQIESYSDGVRLGIAMLVVFFPAYLVLTRKVNQIRRSEGSGNYLGFTKWLVYLSLLVGGGVILGDLVAVILGFLNGELTTRFMLKAGVLLLVVGSAFYYYFLDAKGFWSANEQKSVFYGIVTGIFVLISLGVGFNYIETPNVVREMKLDEKQITDLQDIQFRIENYLQVNNELPKTVAELYVGVDLPSASEERKGYEYNVTDKGFTLCAEFARPSQNTESLTYPIEADIKNSTRYIKGGNNWDHKEGWYCFERVVSENSNNSVNTTVPTKIVN